MATSDPKFVPLSAALDDSTNKVVRVRFSLPISTSTISGANFSSPVFPTPPDGTSPDAVAGLQLWLKADAITGLADGATVTTWNDSSGLGHNATAANAGPTYHTNQINGLPALTFASNVGMNTSASVTGALTVFIIAVCDNPDNSYQRIVQSRSTNWLIGPYQNAWDYYNNTGGWVYGPAAQKYVWVTCCVTQDPATGYGTLYVNGANKGHTTAIIDIGSIGLGVTTGGGYAEPFQGRLAEVIVYNSVLSSTDITGVTNYLNKKYLPVNVSPVSGDDYAVHLSSPTGSTIDPAATDTITVSNVIDSTGTYIIASPGNTVNINSRVKGAGTSVQKTVQKHGAYATVKTNKTFTSAYITEKTFQPPSANIILFKSGSSTANTITLTFDTNVVLSGPAATVDGWTVSSSNGVKVTISDVTVNNRAITLTTSSQTNGASYTLNFPSTGITGDNGHGYVGPFSYSFTGIGISPTLPYAKSMSATTILIIFSEPVDSTTALNSANYTIDNGLQVLSVSRIDDTSYQITTSTQTSGTTYTITASNIKDLAGNYI